MNDEMQTALLDLELAIKNSNLNKTCVKVTITTTAYETNIYFDYKTPEQLRRQGVSMKNIYGEWI